MINLMLIWGLECHNNESMEFKKFNKAHTQNTLIKQSLIFCLKK